MENAKETVKVNENLKAFAEKLIKDEALQQKMAQCKSPEEAYAVASSVQEGFTFEEFTEAMTALNDAFNQELSKEDLAKAAGGVDTGVIIGSASWVSLVSVPVTYLAVTLVTESLSGAAV